QPVRGHPRRHRRIVHHPPHHVVRQQQPVHLLHYQLRYLAPQQQRPPAHVILDLVEGQFPLPTLVVDQRHLACRQFPLAEQIRDQSVPLPAPRPLRVVVCVLDHPHSQPPPPENAALRGGIEPPRARPARHAALTRQPPARAPP